MKKVEFSAIVDSEVEVTVDGTTYGKLVFDEDQNAWVLWPEQIDDGITYDDDLEATKETITDEINDYED